MGDEAHAIGAREKMVVERTRVRSCCADTTDVKWMMLGVRWIDG